MHYEHPSGQNSQTTPFKNFLSPHTQAPSIKENDYLHISQVSISLQTSQLETVQDLHS